jgi:HD-GYP domain-containing protein (c-di-GMP phosphodiesterase class II)
MSKPLHSSPVGVANGKQCAPPYQADALQFRALQPISAQVVKNPARTMKLLRLCIDQIRLHEPLPWSVRNEPGHLLLSKGYLITDPAQIATLIERGVFVDQDEFESEQTARTRLKSPERIDPFKLWTDINQRASAVLMAQHTNPHFQHEVDAVSGDIRLAVSNDVEAGMFEMVFNQPDSYAVSHSVQTAFVACLASERFGWSDDERQTITNAALTMNIAILTLQNTLARQVTPLTPKQRTDLVKHAHDGREILEKNGIVADDWLKTVEQHHVTVDGRALPQDRTDLSQLACMIHYADVYLAKISARASRPAMPSNLAARELYLNAGGANNPYASAIIKEIGLYPPGSCVMLANGETALVVRRGENAHTPQVYSVASSNGRPLKEPVPHDTAVAAYKIVSALPRERVSLRINRQQLFGYEAA